MVRYTRLLAYAAVAAVTLGVTCAPATLRHAGAEEKGMQIQLAYVRGYSTWGPTNVYGDAQFWPSEAVALLHVHNLPRQLNHGAYVSWVVNTATGDAIRLGSFNTNDAGDASQDIVFNDPLPRGANALLVTVWHPGQPQNAPGALRTLAGFFPPQAVRSLEQGGGGAAGGEQTTDTPAPTATPVPSAPVPARPAGIGSGRGQSGHGTAHQHPRSTPISVSRHGVVMLPITGGGPAADPATASTGLDAYRLSSY